MQTCIFTNLLNKNPPIGYHQKHPRATPSRLRTSLKKSREVYKLIQHDKHDGRNKNEIKWRDETAIQTMSESRWESADCSVLLPCINFDSVFDTELFVMTLY